MYLNNPFDTAYKADRRGTTCPEPGRAPELDHNQPTAGRLYNTAASERSQARDSEYWARANRSRY